MKGGPLVLVVALGLPALSVAQGLPGADVSPCTRKYQGALTKCEQAKTRGEQKLQKICKPKEDVPVEQLWKTAKCYRDVANELEQAAEKCKKDAIDARDECGKTQAKLNQLDEAAQNAIMIAGDILQTVPTLGGRQALPQLKPAHDTIHKSWWGADELSNRRVPEFYTTVERIRQEATNLERQAQLQSPNAPTNGSSTAPAGTAPDQAGGMNPVQSLASSTQPPAAAGGSIAAGATNPPAYASIPNPPFVPGTPFAPGPEGGPAGEAPVSPAETAEGGAAGGSLSSDDGASPTDAAPAGDVNPSEAVAAANALPPLPEKETASNPAAGQAKPDAGTASASASAAGSFGSAADSSRGWTPSFGLTSMVRDASVALFGPGEAKKSPSSVDLSRFLPSNRRGPAAAEKLGIHGPHADMFGEIRHRYYEMRGSFEP